MKKILIFSAMLMASTVFCGTEGRLYAMKVYGAPCGPASGFAGFLQRTHFIPTGGCAVSKTEAGYGCANPGNTCSSANPVSGKTQSGTCQTQANTCVCVIGNK